MAGLAHFPTTIPPERTPFVGRARERARLLSELRSENRLVTITGPSGMGKTRLARKVLEDMAESFPGGAWFCNLAACRTGADLQAAVASTLGIPQSQGNQLSRAIASRGAILLVLDNLDEVVAAARPVIEEWFDQCGEARFLTTSIVPLGMEMEVRFELGPLDEADAVALYLERSHRAWAERSLFDTDANVVSELVGKLDRIPLALELAAARVRVLPPRALLSRMDQRFEILQSSRAGRHGSLVRALTLTWDLLTTAEQRVLAAVSCFEGGFDIDAATAIAALDARESIDLLDNLRLKALVQTDGQDPPRFSLFESVRAFAALELERLGEAGEMGRRHASYFVENGERHAELIGTSSAPSSLGWLRVERDNLIAVLRRTLASDPELAARAGLALAPVLSLEGPLVSEAELVEQTLLAARASGKPELVVRALRDRILTIVRYGTQDEALFHVEEGLMIARAHGLREQEGHLLIAKGTLQTRMGEGEAAIRNLEAALALGRGEGFPLVEATALQYLAAAERARAAHERAASLYRECLSILRRHGHLRQEGVALGNFAVVLTEQGRLREARSALEDGLRIARLLGSVVSESSSLANLSGVELVAGLLDQAESYALQALGPGRRFGNLRPGAVALGNLGVIALERGEADKAEGFLLQAVGLFEESGDRRLQAAWLCFLAVAQSGLDLGQEAARTMEDARSFFTAAGDERSLMAIELLEGVIELRQERRNDERKRRSMARCRKLLEATDAREGPASGDSHIARRLLLRELEVAATAGKEPEKAAEGGTLLVGSGAEWFELPGMERVDLRRRGAAQRMFAALVEQSFAAPGVGLSKHELFEIGWQGSEVDPISAATRVYNEVRTLRSLGLSKALLNHASGYLLDPDLAIVRRG